MRALRGKKWNDAFLPAFGAVLSTICHALSHVIVLPFSAFSLTMATSLDLTVDSPHFEPPVQMLVNHRLYQFSNTVYIMSVICHTNM